MCVPSITSKYMLDGTIEVFYLWDPIKLGYVTYYAAKLHGGRQDRGQARRLLHHPEGKKWPGTYTIGGDNGNEIVTGEPLAVHAENIKDHNY